MYPSSPLQYSGPEVRWVDGGKELFKVSFILVSTVNSKVSLLFPITLFALPSSFCLLI